MCMEWRPSETIGSNCKKKMVRMVMIYSKKKWNVQDFEEVKCEGSMNNCKESFRLIN